MRYRVLPKSDHLPHALYRAEQVRALDQCIIEQYSIPANTLIERAGKATFELIQQRWPTAKRILVLAGLGNNAADGFVLAKLALEIGLDVEVLQLGDTAKYTEAALFYSAAYQSAGGSFKDYETLPQGYDLIVDAMLGTGVKRDFKGQWLNAVTAVNEQRAVVLSLDIPTGLDTDTGTRLAAAIEADVTISFIGLKQGMFTADAVDCCGDIVFDSLEAPAKAYASQILSARRIDWDKQMTRIEPRKASAHKGHFGHVLVIGGDHGFGGAVLLAAEAAARCGAGLVSVATRSLHVAGILAARPELTVHAVDHEQALLPLLQTASVIVLGPGLGQMSWGRAMFEASINSDCPMVLDADGLNLLASMTLNEGLSIRKNNWVLTPHPGEAATLLGICNAMINEDRFAIVQQLQQRFGGSTILKGAGTLIDSQGQSPIALCSDGNPGMASAGMGDVLSGVIAALLAQGWPTAEAAELGVCLHAAAADRAVDKQGERGLVASDLMPHLRKLSNGL